MRGHPTNDARHDKVVSVLFNQLALARTLPHLVDGYAQAVGVTKFRSKPLAKSSANDQSDRADDCRDDCRPTRIPFYRTVQTSRPRRV
ncbi:hypothetical protein GCM10028798_03050 [Humibacter antri]